MNVTTACLDLQITVTVEDINASSGSPSINQAMQMRKVKGATAGFRIEFACDIAHSDRAASSFKLGIEMRGHGDSKLALGALSSACRQGDRPFRRRFNLDVIAFLRKRDRTLLQIRFFLGLRLTRDLPKD